MAGRGAVFVLPSATRGQRGPVASWVSTAGWASAGRRVLGSAWIATPDGLRDPDEARGRGSAPHLSSGSSSWWRSHLPTTAKTVAKDVRQWRRARRFSVEPDGPWDPEGLAFVWQRHELFHTAGIDLARHLEVPSVLFVPAALVWEAKQWGVARPGTAKLLERLGERPALKAATLVACGSTAVADQVLRIGVPEPRVIVTPSGVDLDLFPRDVDPEPLRHRLGLQGRFVVGWVGSFRRFHAVELALDAIAALDGASLLLVGDGPERPRLARLARERDLPVVFTGTIPNHELPAHLAAMDAAVVLAPVEGSFHYSPLKLAEYLAAGLPVVAAKVEQLADRLSDDVDAVLVDRDDPGALADAIRALQDDPARRQRLGQAARAAAEARWSWDRQVRRVVGALDDLAAAPR